MTLLLDRPESPLCVPRRSLSDLEYYSIHESGHVVVASALGVRVAGMVVRADVRSGEVAGVAVIPTEDEASMFDMALVALAGMAASQLAGIDHATALQGATADFVNLHNFSRFVHPGARKMIGPATFDLLRLHWAGVLALSTSIADHGELDAEDITRVLADAA